MGFDPTPAELHSWRLDLNRSAPTYDPRWYDIMIHVTRTSCSHTAHIAHPGLCPFPGSTTIIPNLQKQAALRTSALATACQMPTRKATAFSADLRQFAVLIAWSSRHLSYILDRWRSGLVHLGVTHSCQRTRRGSTTGQGQRTGVSVRFRNSEGAISLPILSYPILRLLQLRPAQLS